MSPSASLRVALVAPPWFEVPPDGYGGIEQMVGELANGLTALGHTVVLLAAGDDRTDATLIPTFDEPPEGLGTPDAAATELVHAARVADALERVQVDVVHDHTFVGPLLARERSVPTVLTVHGPIEDTTAELYAESDVSLVAISDSQRMSRPRLPWIATVHNGIDVDRHPFSAEKEPYFLFLGRMNPDKGVEEAISIARATRTPLRIAAKCEEPVEREYFEQRIEPMLDAEIRYVGPVGTDEKFDLLRSARALLFPIQWEEPFGLVMVEALACGTPVIATPRGSVPEIVVDGETGFIAEDVDGLIEGARRIDEIDPAACRRDARERFDTSVMTAGYEAVYRALADATRLRAVGES
jgi:glycosyltransferase involved in cell wall biosynthesis